MPMVTGILMEGLPGAGVAVDAGVTLGRAVEVGLPGAGVAVGAGAAVAAGGPGSFGSAGEFARRL